MKGIIPDIIGSNQSLYSHYNILKKLDYIIPIDNVFKNNINPNKDIIETKPINKSKTNNLKQVNKLQWIFRNFEDYHEFIYILNDFEIESSKYSSNEQELHILSGLLKVLKLDIISNYINDVHHNEYKNIIEIIILIYNVLNTETNIKAREILLRIFNKLKYMNNKYNELI